MSNETPETRQEILSKVAGNARTLCKKTWWVFLIGGIASVIFGILALIEPGAALLVLAVYFAASVLVDGVVNMVGAFQNRDKEGWVMLLLIGLLGAVVGAYALANPPASMAAFIYLVGFMAVLLGILLITLGRKVREEVDREWLLYISGALSVLWGVLIFIQPAAGGVSVIWMIASWAIAIGMLRIFFALKARNLADHAGEKIAAARVENSA